MKDKRVGRLMKYAIDRFELGLEKVVSADSFYNKYIPKKNTRFFCPECGEPVFWRSRGGTQPDKFSHHKETEGTPECNKRANGRSRMNLYEHVGLPVYLTVNSINQYCLNIGFPAVGKQLLEKADQQKAKIYIRSAEYQRTISVNTVHFFEDSITLIPINFIPASGKDFEIKIVSDMKITELRKKWSGYADGFGHGGAIFTYGENGGKKIRRGDTVSPDRQYYVIAGQFNPPQEICSQKIGNIFFNSNVYNVYLISINVSIEDINRYKAIENYLQKQFSVGLLQTAPELISLWPPVVEQGVRIPVKSNGKMYCSVSSGNDEPNVYRYDGCEASLVKIDKNESDIRTVVFSVSPQEMFLSVDRKYAGREVSFQIKKITYPNFKYNFSVEKENGILIPWKDVTSDILSESFFLNTNTKIEMYIGNRDKTFRHISVREQRVSISYRYNSEEVLFVLENSVIMHFRIKIVDRTKRLKESLTVDKIRKCCKGEWIPIPYWVANILFELRRTGFGRISDEVNRIICNGKMPAGLLKILYDYCNARGYHL